MAGWNQIVNELYAVLNQVNDHYYVCVQEIYLDTRISLGDRLWKITKRNYEHFSYQYNHLRDKLKELGGTIDFSQETLRQEIKDWTKIKIAALKTDLENQIDDAKSELIDIIEEIETGIRTDLESRLDALETDMLDVWAWMDEEYYATIEQVLIDIQANSEAILQIIEVDLVDSYDRLTDIYEELLVYCSNNLQLITDTELSLIEKIDNDILAIQTDLQLQIDDIYDYIGYKYASLYDYIDNEIEYVLHIFDDPEEQLRWALNISAQQWQVIDDNIKLILINALS